MTRINFYSLRFMTICLSMVMLIAGESWAQSESFSGGRIERILVEGNQRIEPSTVASYLIIQAGDPFDPEAIDLSLKTLFATGLFADVTMGRRSNNLIIRVVENPIINRVVFEGNKAKDDEDLYEEVDLRPRIVYTRAKVQADVQKILEFYRRAGRFAATVNPKVIQLPQNRVDLVFEVNEGDETGISKINFVGNEAFDDGDLKKVMVTSESRWWKFLESNDNYDPDRLAFDQEQLRKFYLSEGYADFRVVSAVAELTRDRKSFFITMTVEEGDKYKFGEMTVTTELEALNADALSRLINVETGDTYNADRIDNIVDAMTFAAGVQGYAFVDIRPRTRKDRDAKTIDITFEISEGPRVYVERININGNVRTLDHVIRREVRVLEGDAYNKILINRSRARIRGLGYFKEVEITEEPGTSPDKTVLNVDVEEQSTGELSIGAGFSSTDNFITDFSISERNLLGRGQFLRLRVTLSGRRQQVDIRFTEPYFLNRRLAAGFDIFKTTTDFSDESGFETDSVGFGLRAGFPLTEFTSANVRYTLRQDDIQVSDALCDSGIISIRVCAQRGEDITSVVGYTVATDRRNDPIEPTRGWRASFTQDIAGLGGDVKYLRNEGQAAWYYGIWEDVVFSVQGTGGYIMGLGDDDVRLNDRFFKGGNSFRGFDVSGIGPRDLRTQDALGGNIYAIGTVELRFPVGLPEEFGIRGALFTEFGTLGELDSSDQGPFIADDLSLRASAGVSIFWDSPFGPVRLDFANAFQKEDYDETESFRFSAGTRF